MSARVLKVHRADNVLVALQDLARGEQISFEGVTYTLVDDIPAKHKFFMHDMKTGDAVTMYGVLVGKAQYEIPAGARMSTENIKHAADPYDYRGVKFEWSAPDVSKFAGRTFNGYHRPDGRVGTANYWLFIPTVFCENRNLDVIREALHNELGYAVTAKYKQYARSLVEAYSKGEDLVSASPLPFGKGSGDGSSDGSGGSRVFRNVDGIKFLNHQGGCGGIRQDAA
ncbi:MAG: altronate dehydratase, partial [Chitinophagaceae bacterium]